MTKSPRNRVWLIVCLALTVGAVGAFAGFSGTDVFLVSVGAKPGVPPSVWYTTVWIHNPGATPANVTVYLLERQANPSPLSFTDTIQGGDTKRYDNAVQLMFAKQTFGALRITSNVKVIVSSRIYSQAGPALEDSVGQFFAGVPASFAIEAGESTEIVGGWQTQPADASTFRLNFGFVEVTGSGTCQVKVTVKDHTGMVLATKTYTVHQWEQVQKAFKDEFPAISADNVRLTVEVLSGPGKIIGFGSDVANGSQDASTLEMQFADDLLAENAGAGTITGVTAGAGLTGGGTTGDVTVDVGAGAGIHVDGDAVSIADGGVTPTMLSAAGSTAGQVLTSNGGAVAWQDSPGFTLPYSGSASTPLPVAVLAITNTGNGYAVAGTAAGSIGVKGSSNGTGGYPYGVYGNNSTSNCDGALGLPTSGVYGGGCGSKVGVNGRADSGTGVLGEANGGTGVRGTAGANGFGVVGMAGPPSSVAFLGPVGVAGDSGPGYGVLGSSTSGSGVAGFSSSGDGVRGEAGGGAGVRGTAGATGFGVVGLAGTPSSVAFLGPIGVAGDSGQGYGVLGSSDSGSGIAGFAGIGDGVYGEASGATAFGVHGKANGGPTARGVYGESFSGFGVYGYTHGSTAGGSGVYGVSEGSNGVGVRGEAAGSGATAIGVFGTANAGDGLRGISQSGSGAYAKNMGSGCDGIVGSPYAGIYGGGCGAKVGVNGRADSGTGVLGEATGSGVGVRGTSATGTAVRGESSGGAGASKGVEGVSTAPSGSGVVGEANNGSNAYGVWGKSTSGYAGYFSGNVQVAGTLSKSSGSFKIDHPLDPEHKYLYHSFVESPDMKNVYDGVVTLDDFGEAVVRLPDWFEALNRDFRYQLTCIGAAAVVYIAEEIHDGRFRIAGGKPGMKVSWQVTGIRQDAWANAHRIPVEEEKPEAEQGTYIHPELFGAPADLSVDRVGEPGLPRSE